MSCFKLRVTDFISNTSASEAANDQRSFRVVSAGWRIGATGVAAGPLGLPARTRTTRLVSGWVGIQIWAALAMLILYALGKLGTAHHSSWRMRSAFSMKAASG